MSTSPEKEKLFWIEIHQNLNRVNQWVSTQLSLFEKRFQNIKDRLEESQHAKNKLQKALIGDYWVLVREELSFSAIFQFFSDQQRNLAGPFRKLYITESNWLYQNCKET